MGSKTSSRASLGGAAEENERLHRIITEKDGAITALQVSAKTTVWLWKGLRGKGRVRVYLARFVVDR